MTKYLLATAASLALAASAFAANAQTIGYVGANYARANADTPVGDADVDQFQLEGAARFDVGSLGAAVDGAVTHVGGDVADNTDFAVTGHLNTKLGGALVGGFAGVDHSDDLTFWAVGAEGQAQLGAATSLYGQLGYGSSDDLGNPDVWAARAELRHFYTDNFKVQGSAGLVTADTDVGNFDVWNLGVEAEYQFAGTPWSVLGGYDFAKSHDLDSENNTFRVGVRYSFGGSLKARDAAGADLGSARKLFAGAFGF